MALPENNSLYVAINYLQTYFVDKITGLPLAGGKVYFWQDTNRNNLKPVYQLTSDPTYHYDALPNPLTLSNAGTFVDNNGNDIAVYLFPYDSAGNADNYYIQVFAAGEDPPPIGTPEFTREAVPGVIDDISPDDAGPQSLEGFVQNGQFAEVLFDPAVGMTINYINGITEVEIAPGWILKITAANVGQVTVTRTSLSGNSGFVTNPPYSLSIAPGGNIGSMVLYQRFLHNPGIYTNGWINAGIALAPNAPTTNINFVDSNGTSTQILSAAGTATWHYFNRTVQLDISSNPDTSDFGYVDIQIELSRAATTTFTSVQVTGLNDNVVSMSYSQKPVNEQINHLFYYYQPQLEYKQISSYLVGWDFPLNPAQLGETVAASNVGANKSYYAWDQTIIYQNVDVGFTVARAATGAFEVTCAVQGQFALIQYVDAPTVKRLLNSKLCVNVSGSTSIVAGIDGIVSLYYTDDASLPDLKTPNFNSLIATIGTNGKPATFHGVGWTEVPRDSLGNASFTLTTTTTDNFNDVPLAGWNLLGDAALETATYFAIVVGLEEMDAADVVTFNSISLCAGDIPTRPAPQTSDQVFDQCQKFYWSTFSPGTTPAQNAGSDTGEIKWPATRVGGSNIVTVKHPVLMADVPTITTYNPLAAASTVRDFNNNANIPASTSNITQKSFLLNADDNPGAAIAAVGDLLGVHISADARLGIVL